MLNKLTKDFYIENRKKYANLVKDNSITVISSGTIQNSSADEDFDFEVDKNFYYLTGINQEEVTFVLTKINGVVKEYLFIVKNDPIKVKWLGAKLEKDEAKNLSGIENILYDDNYIEDIKKMITSEIIDIYLNLERKSGYHYEHNKVFSHKISKAFPELVINDCYRLIVDLRSIKTKEEVEMVKDAIEVTRIGIEKLMTESHPGMYEYQLENYFDFVIKDNGQRLHSFKTIAAAGVNATTLHYSFNNSLLKDNDLILFDLGTETNFYISDISRTFPINGKFTKRQREVYEEVLNVNKKCIEFLRPGLTKIEYNEYAKRLLTESCYRLHLIDKDEDINKYYFHSIGHSIGLDTHDPCFFENGIEEGMLLTVEPGLYIPEEGIGIRIEDDVLITKDGCVNLSKSIIKEVDEIEEFFKKNNKHN